MDEQIGRNNKIIPEITYCIFIFLPNARINEQSLAGDFFAAQREKGDR
jgi:hypothetical protein